MNAFNFSFYSGEWHKQTQIIALHHSFLYSVAAVSFCSVLYINLLQKARFLFACFRKTVVQKNKTKPRHLIPLLLFKDCRSSAVPNTVPSPREGAPTDSLPSPAPRQKLMRFALFKLNSSP